MTENELHFLCLSWQHWQRTRRLLGAPTSSVPGLLSRMQPGKVYAAPDAAMSALVSAFDAAVRGLPETSEKYCFLSFYATRNGGKPRRPIKAIAADLGLCRATFYNQLRRVRREAYGKAVQIMSDRARDARVGANDAD